MREKFIDRNFNDSSVQVIMAAVGICEEYAAQGYDLTLRQLYYQFVSRGLIPNKDTEYKRLGSIINDARLAGELDWDYIVDRTRFLRDYDTKDSPSSAIMEAARSYIIDLWEDQPYRPEVWIEKDALVGVIETICNRLRIPFFSCRGYVSQSEMYEAAQRMQRWVGQEPIIFHLGDHDPSGIDMTRDIQERLDLFGANCEVNRIALTMDQIRAINPPPFPSHKHPPSTSTVRTGQPLETVDAPSPFWSVGADCAEVGGDVGLHFATTISLVFPRHQSSM